MIYTTKAFWSGAFERAMKTFAQTLAVMITVGVPLAELDWSQGLGLAAAAFLASILTSVSTPTFVAGEIKEDENTPI